MNKRFLYVILTYLIVQFSPFAAVPILRALFPNNDPYTMQIYWIIFAFIAGLLVILWLMKPFMKLDKNDGSPGIGLHIFWYVVGFIMVYVGQIIATFIEVFVFHIEIVSENTEMIMGVSRDFPLFIILTALIAPILEEIIFRKIIFGSIYKKSNFFIAALISAVIFALVHGEPQHILIYGSIGFILAFIYVETKRIIVPILIHMSINSLAVIGRFLLPETDPAEAQDLINQLQDNLSELFNQFILPFFH